ncbi:MAG: tRNA pseudouridine(55) synthase TruB [Chloroflexi bacterium]|nr:MAG: tRNA pseudouridine(55) synthase TruB [Chloroflexota bacterium]
MNKSLAGILVVDKPSGMTSHDVVQRVRRVAATRKVGHAGTLDPLATGVLLVCVGQATRLLEYLVGRPKRYVATVRLGQETDTYDAEGEVVAERPFSHVSREAIEKILPQFRGEIQQRPPAYSAIKQGGQPLYKLARQGVEVERPLRTVTIYQLDLLDWNPPYLKLDITCSSGTYIRSLAHDFGQVLACGGHITSLQRTAVGEFTRQQAVPLAQITAESLPNLLLPARNAVAHLPQLFVTTAEATQLRLGQRIERQAEHPHAEEIAAFDSENRFIGILVARDKAWQPRKIFNGEL